MKKLFNKDFFLSIIPAIICIGVYLLPTYIQEFLILRTNELNWYTWLTHVFVHQNFPHIVSNLALYLICILLIFSYAHERDRKRVRNTILSFILIVPILTLLLTLLSQSAGLFPQQLINHRGFSGISSALIGFLGITTVRHIRENQGLQQDKKYLLYLAYAIFLPGLVILVIQLSWKLSLLIGLFWLFVSIPLLIIYLKGKRFYQLNRLGLIIPLVAFLFLSGFLVPKNLVSNGSVTNSFAHLLGYIIGFWIPFFFWRNNQLNNY